MDKEATEALPATQLEIDKHRFRSAWDTRPAACWTPDKDNPVPSRIGRTSKQVRFLGQRRRCANIRCHGCLASDSSQDLVPGRKGRYASSPHAL